MGFDHQGLRDYTYLLAWRAAKDMESDPFRQLRSYVDTGAMLSRSPGQRFFFSQAQQVLENPESGYYRVIRGLLEQVTRPQLCTVGVNLGISALVYGAGQLRQAAQQTGQPQPWLTLATLESPDQLEPLARQVEKGEAQGDYVYVVCCADALLCCAAMHRICAIHEKSLFLFCMPPQLVGPELLAACGEAINAVPVLELSQERPEPLRQASQQLQQAKLFYGLRLRVTPGGAERQLSPENQESMGSLAPFCVCTLEPGATPQDAAALRRLVYESRRGTRMPLVLMDWQSDVQAIGAFVSPMACLGRVDLLPQEP